MVFAQHGRRFEQRLDIFGGAELEAGLHRARQVEQAVLRAAVGKGRQHAATLVERHCETLQVGAVDDPERDVGRLGEISSEACRRRGDRQQREDEQRGQHREAAARTTANFTIAQHVIEQEGDHDRGRQAMGLGVLRAACQASRRDFTTSSTSP